MRYIKTITISERCRIIYSTDKEAKKVVYWVEVLNKYNLDLQCRAEQVPLDCFLDIVNELGDIDDKE